jgi:uncharacterized membrane protein HdeD (DUF308 family)
MAKTICKVLGVVFLLVGICGFFAPHLLGAHLTPPHNLVHIVSGVIAIYFGFSGSLSGAKGFCLVFGVVYLALGILGLFVFGDPAMDRMWHVGPLELGRIDHLIHVLLGLVFLAGGLLTKKT